MQCAMADRFGDIALWFKKPRWGTALVQVPEGEASLLSSLHPILMTLARKHTTLLSFPFIHNLWVCSGRSWMHGRSHFRTPIDIP